MEQTTYTVTVACQMIPLALRPTRTYWNTEVYEIEEDASWIGFGRASVKAMELAEAKYGKRLADTSYVQEISPVPA